MKSRKKNIKGRVKMNVIHFRALSRRYLDMIFSDKGGLIALILQAPIMLLIIYAACGRNFSSDYYTAHTILFVVAAVCAVMGTLNSYREVCKEREILMREYATGLDATAYVISKIAVQALVCLFHALVLTAGTLIIIDFPLGQWYITIPTYFSVIYLILLASSCLGILVSCMLKSSDSAVLPVLLIIIAQMVLSNTVTSLPDTALMRIITFPVITKWGTAALGRVFDIAGTFPAEAQLGIVNSVYDIPLHDFYIVGLILIVVSVSLSAVFIRRMVK